MKGGNAAEGTVRLYLVVNRDLGVGVALVERFDLADVLLLRELHHPEHHRNLCWKPGELQLTVRRPGEERRFFGGGGVKRREFAGFEAKKLSEEGERGILNNWS